MFQEGQVGWGALLNPARALCFCHRHTGVLEDQKERRQWEEEAVGGMWQGSWGTAGRTVVEDRVPGTQTQGGGGLEVRRRDTVHPFTAGLWAQNPPTAAFQNQQPHMARLNLPMCGVWPGPRPAGLILKDNTEDAVPCVNQIPTVFQKDCPFLGSLES